MPVAGPIFYHLRFDEPLVNSKLVLAEQDVFLDARGAPDNGGNDGDPPEQGEAKYGLQLTLFFNV